VQITNNKIEATTEAVMSPVFCVETCTSDVECSGFNVSPSEPHITVGGNGIIWIVLLLPLFVFCSSSKVLPISTFKAGNKSRFFEVLIFYATLLSCVSFSECYYIYTFAGTGVGGYYGDGGPATSAELRGPFGVTVSSTSEVYIADTGNNVIRVVFTNGTISTFAGGGSSGLGHGGPATSAELNYPTGVAVSSTGEVYIADTFNDRTRAVFSNGTIVTIAGNGTAGYYGDGGPATSAEINSALIGITVSGTGEVYFCDTLIFFHSSGNNRVRVVYTNGTINTLAGNGTVGYYGDGGPATSAGLSNPIMITRLPFINGLKLKILITIAYQIHLGELML
jgi:hypothetical protein